MHGTLRVNAFQCFAASHCYRILGRIEVTQQLTFTCTKPTIETLEKAVKYIQS